VHPDHEVDPSCSFGVARMEPHEDIGSLFRRADAALYTRTAGTASPAVRAQ